MEGTVTDGWTFWRHFVVRGAGFPVDRALVLADSELGARVDAWLATLEEGDTQPSFEEAFNNALARNRPQLRELAREGRFREAVLWQNRHAVHTGIDPLLATPPTATDSRTRSKERLIANYGSRHRDVIAEVLRVMRRTVPLEIVRRSADHSRHRRDL